MHSVGVVRPADEATGAQEEKKNGGKRSKRQRFTAGVGTEAEAKYKKNPVKMDRGTESPEGTETSVRIGRWKAKRDDTAIE